MGSYSMRRSQQTWNSYGSMGKVISGNWMLHPKSLFLWILVGSVLCLNCCTACRENILLPSNVKMDSNIFSLNSKPIQNLDSLANFRYKLRKKKGKPVLQIINCSCWKSSFLFPHSFWTEVTVFEGWDQITLLKSQLVFERQLCALLWVLLMLSAGAWKT